MSIDLSAQPPPTRPARRDRLGVLLGLLACLVLVVAGAAAALAFLPVELAAAPGTYVAGVPVGGLTRSQVDRAVRGPVAAAVQRTVTVHADDATARIGPAAAGIRLDRAGTVRAVLASAPNTLLDRIRASRDSGRHDVDPVLSVDGGALRAVLAAAFPRFDRTARAAVVRLPPPAPLLLDRGTTSFTARPVAGRRVIPSVTGRRLDLASAARAVLAGIEIGRTEVTLAVPLTRPAVDTRQASRVDQLIGTFTTEHPCCTPRVRNIHRIAQLVDGAQIARGARFSLNAAAGERSTARGFVPAGAIEDGEEVDAVGGGVSQFSTTLYNAAWFAGIDIVKHQPHTRYFSRYPPGREATLDWPSIDLVLRNDTDAPIVIGTSYTGTSVTVALYGHTGDRRVASDTGPRQRRAGGGFSVRVTRRITDGGREAGTNFFRWTYSSVG